MVWGIGSSDPLDDLQDFRDQMGITFPILHDPGGAVLDDYAQQTAFPNTIYPQDWIIGADQTVRYVNNGYALDEMIAVVEADLSE